MKYNAQFMSCGHYLPKKIVTNKDLESILDTSDEWIQTRTGIRQRHIAGVDESTAYMGTQACIEALEKSSLKASDIDMIIVATTTADHVFPATATQIQKNINAINACAFDIQAVCAGFIYALSIANSFIQSNQAKNILVVGADRMSSLVDWSDRSTAVLFGDGAGAYLLTQSATKKGILSTHLFSDGTFYNDLYVEKDDKKQTQFIKMMGGSVFKNGVKKMGEAIKQALAFNALTTEHIDCFIPHQANKRIILSIAEYFNLPLDKVQITVDKHANTSAATIPLATYEAIATGKIKAHDRILLTALGGGFSWGSAVLYYQ
jgi:3-oxoacyl-[acyl-carrier-protein] synthase-3